MAQVVGENKVNLQAIHGILGESEQMLKHLSDPIQRPVRRSPVPDSDSTTPRKRDYKKSYWDLKADPERYAAYLEQKRLQRLARQTDKQYETERKRKWRESNREKDRLLHKAHYAVEAALKSGQLIKPPLCQKCWRELTLEAHHYLGYEPEHWLDVLWLCVTCHAREHRESRKAGNDERSN